LQRFGVPTPRLCAVGCDGSRVFLLTEPPKMIRFDQVLAKGSSANRARLLRSAGRLIRQVHEAGYGLTSSASWGQCLGVDCVSGAVVLAKAEALQRASASWTERGPTELNRQKVRLSRSEQMRFLAGYLRKKAARERQAA
jgi:hypothetical protein